MTERTTRSTVEFKRPFLLPGSDAPQPSGIYEVETVEEQIDGLSMIAFRRISTTIALHGRTLATASRQLTTIDPEDLAIALAKDAEDHDGHP